MVNRAIMSLVQARRKDESLNDFVLRIWGKGAGPAIEPVIRGAYDLSKYLDDMSDEYPALEGEDFEDQARRIEDAEAAKVLGDDYFA